MEYFYYHNLLESLGSQRKTKPLLIAAALSPSQPRHRLASSAKPFYNAMNKNGETFAFAVCRCSSFGQRQRAAARNSFHFGFELRGWWEAIVRQT